MIDWLWSMQLSQILAFFLSLNVVILLGALFAERLAARLFTAAPQNGPLSAKELLPACGTVLINAAISIAGWLAWKAGYLRLNRSAHGLTILRDSLVLVCTMDLALYVLHRIAHTPLFYKWGHYLHHRYTETRVRTLFVMHPLEAFGFGSLWVLTLMAFPFSSESVIIFLQLNLYFGVAAHFGFSPYPNWLTRLMKALCIAAPEFHQQHHRKETENYGFYTTVWDRVFRTGDSHTS